MTSSLKTLVRIQKFNIDEQRKLLNEQLDAEDKLLQALAALEDELVREKKFAEENPRIGDFGSYYKRYQAKKLLIKIVRLRKKKMKNKKCRKPLMKSGQMLISKIINTNFNQEKRNGFYLRIFALC